MNLFNRIAAYAAARLLGSSADRRISTVQLAGELEQMALSDPDLAEHYARQLKNRDIFRAWRATEEQQ
jgi:hypothetical protein